MKSRLLGVLAALRENSFSCFQRRGKGPRVQERIVFILPFSSASSVVALGSLDHMGTAGSERNGQGPFVPGLGPIPGAMIGVDGFDVQNKAFVFGTVTGFPFRLITATNLAFLHAFVH